MSRILTQHWPHFGFLAIGVGAFLWFAYRPEGERPSASEEPPRPAPAPATVRRSVARRGLLALGPLLVTVATGAVLYGLDVARERPSGGVIWIHSGIAALALVLVVYKVGDLGPDRIRRALGRQRLHELGSIVLALLSVPLTLTGVALLLAPSTGSSTAYMHLISSAWWTGLMVWHLRRYLGASLRAALSGSAPARAGGTAPGSARAASVPRSDPQPSRPA